MPLLEPRELRDIVDYVRRHREGGDHFEVVTYADLSGDKIRVDDLVAEWEESGATWIHVGPADFGMEPPESFRTRVRNGPPRR